MGTNATLALAIVLRLVAAVARAASQDRDVTDKELNNALNRADQADKNLQDAIDSFEQNK